MKRIILQDYDAMTKDEITYLYEFLRRMLLAKSKDIKVFKTSQNCFDIESIPIDIIIQEVEYIKSAIENFDRLYETQKIA